MNGITPPPLILLVGWHTDSTALNIFYVPPTQPSTNIITYFMIAVIKTLIIYKARISTYSTQGADLLLSCDFTEKERINLFVSNRLSR